MGLECVQDSSRSCGESFEVSCGQIGSHQQPNVELFVFG